MRIAIMGSGGVGGYFGARLAAAGHDVWFIARGSHLDAMRAHGLKIESPRGDLRLAHVQVTDDPIEAGAAEIVLFGVKLWDTADAARAIAPLLKEDTGVVSFQNGVVKDEILRTELGASHVLGGVCYIASTIARAGVIRHAGSLQKLVFGEYGGAVSARVERFAQACLQAGIDIEISSEIERTIWEKFVFLVGLSATTSVVRTSIGPIREDARARAFLRDVMDEVVQVARAEGIALPIDYANDRLAFADTIPATMTSSMYNDLERGQRLEVPWLSGDIVRRGERLAIATPCNRAITDILSVHSHGRAK